MTGAEPLTRAQIAERSGVHHTAISKVLPALGAIHVGAASGTPRHGPPAGLYVLPDASPGVNP